jgi:hypothetical protein
VNARYVTSNVDTRLESRAARASKTAVPSAVPISKTPITAGVSQPLRPPDPFGVYEDEAGAEESSRAAASWIREHLPAITGVSPQVSGVRS